ncbi:MAG: hypothetical protein ACI9Y7_002728 [Dokdonia sp.]|jgi:hypothetical protein
MDEIKKIIESFAERIEAPRVYLPTYNHSEDVARPHIEKQGDEYHWVVVERGEELQRKKTTEIKELMFWVFDSITFQMAITLELKNRNDDEDFRIQMFRIQEELIGKIDREYEKRIAQKHQKLLKGK